MTAEWLKKSGQCVLGGFENHLVPPVVNWQGPVIAAAGSPSLS